MTEGPGPLVGINVIACEAIGPVPFACNHLADLGATVTRIVRTSPGDNRLPEVLTSILEPAGETVALDLKDAQGRDAALNLIDGADVLIEGFRPGTMERLGLGPEVVLKRNAGIVYARVTGWGQTGPYASMAGHDINYIGLAGVLHAIGSGETPIPPLNLVGDYAGGSMYAISGVLAALVERNMSGTGSVIDIAMVDGAGALLGPMRTMLNSGTWRDERASNMLDGGAPFYRAYRTSDGKHMAVGALEPAFYLAFVAGLGLDVDALPDRLDPRNWEDLGETFASVFAEKSRDDWCAVFDGSDACVTPVLSMSEVMTHRHNEVRGALVQSVGGLRPAPAPRFDGSTPSGHARVGKQA